MHTSNISWDDKKLLLQLTSCTLYPTSSVNLCIIWQPYFCGQLDACLVLGSDWALQRAKENVDKWWVWV